MEGFVRAEGGSIPKRILDYFPFWKYFNFLQVMFTLFVSFKLCFQEKERALNWDETKP